MANRKSMPLLTELEELNGRLFSINISLRAELADILYSVSFGEIGTVLETQAGHRILLGGMHHLGIKAPLLSRCE